MKDQALQGDDYKSQGERIYREFRTLVVSEYARHTLSEQLSQIYNCTKYDWNTMATGRRSILIKTTKSLLVSTSCETTYEDDGEWKYRYRLTVGKAPWGRGVLHSLSSPELETADRKRFAIVTPIFNLQPPISEPLRRIYQALTNALKNLRAQREEEETPEIENVQ